MREVLRWMSVVMVAAILLAGCGPEKSLPLEQRREVVADMETWTLQRLYKEAPETQAKIRNAPGYAAFSNANVNLLIASAGGGYGVVVDNATRQRTYIKMALGGSAGGRAPRTIVWS